MIITNTSQSENWGGGRGREGTWYPSTEKNKKIFSARDDLVKVSLKSDVFKNRFLQEEKRLTSRNNIFSLHPWNQVGLCAPVREGDKGSAI